MLFFKWNLTNESASSLNGFLTKFCVLFWGIIKSALLDMFYDFYAGKLHLFSLNFGTHYCQNVKKLS